MKMKTVKIEILSGYFGQTHFIKSVEDIHEALINSAPNIKFGVKCFWFVTLFYRLC
ncbi:MAG: hypothetical protein DRP62_04615 [Planctomycetota bacterium]|nr:MAG: hypothetical protein DRP62_04615 [Planctomycetota bacterium]